MRQLNRIETALLLIGGLLMVAGACGNLFFPTIAPYLFAPGSVLFAAMQMRQRYEGTNFTIRRLRRIMVISDVLFMVAALMMIANQANFLGLDFLVYLYYIHNNWIVLVFLAAVMQLYTTHRIGHELEKEEKNTK